MTQSRGTGWPVHGDEQREVPQRAESAYTFAHSRGSFVFYFFFFFSSRRRHTRLQGDWSSDVCSSDLASAIEELLRPLPIRFREYLGTVCQSHHEDDLHITNLYPLAAALGSHRQEIVNVQYAAVLLRTADLLHITKDRTPS